MNKKFELIADFIRTSFKKDTEFIALHEPIFEGNEIKYSNDAIKSTFVSSVGKYVDEFEEEIAKYTGATKAVACVNGTSALHLALLIGGVEKGDEVITQDLTFIATTNAIRYCNAEPIFIDVDRHSYGLSPIALNNWLEENVDIVIVNGEKQAINKKTGATVRACVPMHTFGHPCDMDSIMDICNKYGINVIEDAAESMGSFYKGKHTGTIGLIGVVSFNGNKIITTGGGGMLLFNDSELAAKAKHLSTQAKMPHAWEYKHDHIGYNYRMPNINAALGVAQLEELNNFVARKRKLSERYMDFFQSIEIEFVTEPVNSQSNYWLNAVLLKDKEERNSFLEFMNAKKIMTRPLWEPMHTLTMNKDAQCGDLTNSKYIAERLVNIPSSAISL
ncbi:LegC family aminotransferase [Ulvibacter litoralis]|uniref:GDP-perosamine synthase n=1 Tax=Ulvibacter litoralis TaxID=227084 RepID=A0A1G7HMW7_9FLAO|nr:LegC family aminotransferase [Ulvibacter litoralis]GHC58418.1 aminotransferase DegT [Ulvibacter litoralis]SDF01782.1 aminotransferase, LLPSF_NHT_00031 family [Ulvibacter litoralis]